MRTLETRLSETIQTWLLDTSSAQAKELAQHLNLLSTRQASGAIMDGEAMAGLSAEAIVLTHYIKSLAYDVHKALNEIVDQGEMAR